jgi:hypothetical protein
VTCLFGLLDRLGLRWKWLDDWVVPTMIDSPATTRCPQCLALVPDIHAPVHKLRARRAGLLAELW